MHRRWTEGHHDAAVLHAEITILGFRGSLCTVTGRMPCPRLPGTVVEDR